MTDTTEIAENAIATKELEEYYHSLHSNWKNWFLLQVKQTMLAGKKQIFVSVLYSKYYKKWKTPLNFLKPTPEKYYDTATNVYVTHQKTRELIDYIESLGLNWFVGIYWDATTVFSIRYFTIHAKWPKFVPKHPIPSLSETTEITET
jgi:hypothetical protein